MKKKMYTAPKAFAARVALETAVAGSAKMKEVTLANWETETLGSESGESGYVEIDW
jgi:hypothetical protein